MSPKFYFLFYCIIISLFVVIFFTHPARCGRVKSHDCTQRGGRRLSLTGHLREEITVEADRGAGGATVWFCSRGNHDQSLPKIERFGRRKGRLLPSSETIIRL